jgi:hypothetical protein
MISNPYVQSRLRELMDAVADDCVWRREDSIRALLAGLDMAETTRDCVAAVRELNSMHGYVAPAKVQVDGGVRVVVSSDDAAL